LKNQRKINMAFKKGNKLAGGGYRKGAGRKPSDFHTQLEAGLSDGEVLQTVLNMAKGVGGLWSEKIRLSAAQWLLEMQNGKANQALEHSGKDGSPLVIQLVDY
jgi:hypothetical protein